MAQQSKKRPQYAEGRDALIEAASRVVARDGFGGLTYRSVADQAGTTHGLVSYHFGTRDNLVHEMVLTACRDSIERSLMEPDSGELDDFAGGLAELVASSPDEQALQFELALEARRREQLVPEVRALYDEYLEVTKEALQRFDVEPDDALVRLIFAALDGLTLQQLIYGRPQDTEDSIVVLHEIMRSMATAGARKAKRYRRPRTSPAQ